MNLKPGKLQGFDCVIESNLPVGAGISSSSALICGIAKGVNELYNLDLSDDDLIFLAKDVEHNFIGLKGGIMDQFTICKAKKNKLLLLNCTSLDYRYIDANFYPYKILLLNSNVPHKLSDSEYKNQILYLLPDIFNNIQNELKISFNKSMKSINVCLLCEPKL